MDFARKIMQNCGWKDGDGLGKNKNGITKPLKATLKFDNSGFGADQAADDFNNHWWERVFNEAATNVNITKEGEQIKMKLKDEDDSVEISTKGYSMKKLKKLKSRRGEISVNKSSYENFLQAATLTNLGGEIEHPDKIDTSCIEVSKVHVLSDDELFKACGGRTAHKGARHGLKLSGKLSRIEQQEGELLAKMMAKRKGLSDGKLSENELQTNKIQKQKFDDQRNNKNNAEEKADKVYEMLQIEGGKLKKKKRKLCEIVSVETDTNKFDTKNVQKYEEKINKINAGEKANEVCEMLHVERDELKKKKQKLCKIGSAEKDSNIQDTAFVKMKKKKKLNN